MVEASFAVKSGLILFRVAGSGLVGRNSDIRANSAQVQMNLPTRAELDNKNMLET